MVFCKLQIKRIHNLKQCQKISVFLQEQNMIGKIFISNSSQTPFLKFLHLPSINKTCSAGDINSMNLLVCD